MHALVVPHATCLYVFSAQALDLANLSRSSFHLTCPHICPAGAPPPAGYPYPPQPQPGAAPGPYPPQQQQPGPYPPTGQFAQAPAGYPAMPAGGPPGFDNSSLNPPMKPHEMQQQQGPAAVGYIAPGPGPSPGAGPHMHQQQQQHPGQYAPAPGYPVGGGAPGGMAVVAGPGQQQQEKCGCSIGWVLFGVRHMSLFQVC
jgi:hypothetical protein